MLKDEKSEIEKLHALCAKKDKIIKALTDRVESILCHQDSSFGQFEESVMLTKIVNERTEHLARVKKNLEKDRYKIEQKNIELIKIKKELTTSLEYNKALVDSLQDCLVVINKDKSIKGFNKKFEEIFGGVESIYSEIVLSRIIDDGDEDVTEFLLDGVFDMPKDGAREIELVTTDGIVKCFLVSASTFKDKENKEYIVTLKDISKLKMVEKEVERERAKSISASKLASLGEMAGGIAHEINNPLAIISATMAMLRKMIDKGMERSPKFRGAIDDVDKTILRITKIISGLRNISRDTSEEEFENCLVSDLIGDVTSLCSEKLRSNFVELEVDAREEVWSSNVTICRVQLSQVILNLISNAYDEVYLKDNRWIRIKIDIVNENLEIRIVDSGEGIEKKVREKIFQPFFTTKDIGKGTGLGLSLSHSIVTKKHGGKLYVDSESPNTCFVVQLPFVKAG